MNVNFDTCIPKTTERILTKTTLRLYQAIQATPVEIDSFHIVISLSNRSSIEKSIKLFLKMKGQMSY